MDFTQNKTQLCIFIDDDEKAELKAMKNDDPDHFKSDAAMYEFFEPLIANSELSWIDPADTGDLTDAPMLGILDYNEHRTHKTGPYGAVDVGMGQYQPILQRWAFMDYQIRNPLDDLLAMGKVHFIS